MIFHGNLLKITAKTSPWGFCVKLNALHRFGWPVGSVLWVIIFPTKLARTGIIPSIFRARFEPRNRGLSSLFSPLQSGSQQPAPPRCLKQPERTSAFFCNPQKVAETVLVYSCTILESDFTRSCIFAGYKRMYLHYIYIYIYIYIHLDILWYPVYKYYIIYIILYYIYMQVDDHHFLGKYASKGTSGTVQRSHQATHDIGIHAVMLHQSTTSAGIFYTIY